MGVSLPSRRDRRLLGEEDPGVDGATSDRSHAPCWKTPEPDDITMMQWVNPKYQQIDDHYDDSDKLTGTYIQTEEFKSTKCYYTNWWHHYDVMTKIQTSWQEFVECWVLI